MVKLTKKLSGVFPIFLFLEATFASVCSRCCSVAVLWENEHAPCRISGYFGTSTTFQFLHTFFKLWNDLLFFMQWDWTTFDQVHSGLIHGAAVAGHESGKGAAKTAGYIFHGWGFVEVNTDRVVSSNQKQWFLVGCPWKSATSYLILRDVSNLLIQGWNSAFSKYQQDIPVVSSKNCMESFKNVVGHKQSCVSH